MFSMSGKQPSFAEDLLSYSSSFKWERDVTPMSCYTTMGVSIAGYLLLVFLLSRLVKRGVKIPTPVAALHNVILCAGSLVMFLGLAYQSYLVSKASGTGSWLFCLPLGTRVQGRLYFWTYVYYLSKYYELLDTVLLGLKAKPMSFLHVFHHSVVIPMAYFYLEMAQSLQQVAMLTNTAVHVVMYYYYLMCTLKRPPKWKKVITNIQIWQFMFSFAASGPLWYLQITTGKCSGVHAVVFNAVFNLILLALFANFHRQSYRKRSSKLA